MKTDTVIAPTAAQPGSLRSALTSLARIQNRYPLIQLTAVVGLFAYGTSTIIGFSSGFSVRSMLVLAALLGLASVGQTIIILIGGIDFSVPSFIAAGSVCISELVGAYHWSFAAASAFLLAGSALIGALTGIVCRRYGLQPLVVTLGTSGMVTGALQVWTKGSITGTSPAWLGRVSSPAAKTFGVGVPPIVAVWAAVAILVSVGLHRTVVGRWIYATGANPRAAELALVPTTRVWAGAFAGSAVFSALVGILLLGFSGSGSLTVGDDYLFQSIAVVLVGGTALIGARGDYWRTAVGALLLVEITTILVGQGASSADSQIIFGLLILVVVAGYGRDRHLRDRI